jgi:hypothetical protein
VYQFRGDWVESSVTEIDRAPATASVATGDWPFKPYTSAYTGDGDAPTDQPRRLRIIAGSIGGIIASNWNSEFPMPINKESYWCWLKISLDADANVRSTEYKFGNEPPTADYPTDGGVLPTTIYAPLFTVDTNRTAITAFYSSQTTNLALNVSVSKSGCSTVKRYLSLS